jgi:hypothetical protein
MSEDLLVTHATTYDTAGNSPIHLTVTIGNGNAGGSSVLWKRKIIKEGAIIDLPIGNPGDTLRNKTLRATTKVRVVNPSSEQTSVTFILSGGAKTEEFLYTLTAPKGKDVTYVITFDLD